MFHDALVPFAERWIITMKIEDARKIIQEEGLQGYNLCEERENRENEVVLKKENEKCME